MPSESSRARGSEKDPDFFAFTLQQYELDKFTYTGRAISPRPVVAYDGRILVEGVDYWLSYENNVQAGTATSVLTGLNRFIEDKEVPFTISKASIKKAASNGS